MAIWEGIKSVFEFGVGLVAGIVLAVFDAMGIDLVSVFQKISDFFVNVWASIKETFNVAIQEIAMVWNEVWQAISDFITPIWEAIKGTVQAGWTWLKTKFQEFTEPIRKAWNGLWDGLASGVTTAWESVKNTVKQSINWIIEKINVVINAINAVAQKGAKVIGFNAPQIPNIPMLAKGGIVNSPTLAMIGEAGPEAVVPLSKMGGMGMGGMTVIINNPEFRTRDDETRMRRMLDDYFRPLLVNHKIT
jgi:phage-related protein